MEKCPYIQLADIMYHAKNSAIESKNRRVLNELCKLHVNLIEALRKNKVPCTCPPPDDMDTL